jgi:hypothetical protein
MCRQIKSGQATLVAPLAQASLRVHRLPRLKLGADLAASPCRARSVEALDLDRAGNEPSNSEAATLDSSQTCRAGLEERETLRSTHFGPPNQRLTRLLATAPVGELGHHTRAGARATRTPGQIQAGIAVDSRGQE